MFVLWCIRRRFRKLVALLVIIAGCLAWFSGRLQEKTVDAHETVQANVVEKTLEIASPTVEGQLFHRHGLQKGIRRKINVNVTDATFIVSSQKFNLSEELLRSAKVSTKTATLCNQECVLFRNILSSWPHDKPKTAVYYLAKASRMELLNSSLMSLYHSFLHRFDYPVIVFHEADSQYLIKRWRFYGHVNIRLFFQEVKFEFPTHVNVSAVKFDIRCLSHISYRHMCRFHAKQVYEQPILVGLDYIWRLDDDSLLPATINYDIFAFMQQNHFQYGYIKIHFDSYDCTIGLWEAVRHYVKLKHLESSNFEKWTEPKIFYNNFEISALSLWISEPYKDYINYIDSLGGIYYYRWGDAPIKSIAVTLLLSKEATHLFKDVTYMHRSLFTNLSYSSF